MPMSRVFSASARSSSRASWTSTSTAMPKSRAQASSAARRASSSAATISRIASAPIARASATCYSSMMKSLRSAGSAHAARAAVRYSGSTLEDIRDRSAPTGRPRRLLRSFGRWPRDRSRRAARPGSGSPSSPRRSRRPCRRRSSRAARASKSRGGLAAPRGGLDRGKARRALRRRDLACLGRENAREDVRHLRLTGVRRSPRRASASARRTA